MVKRAGWSAACVVVGTLLLVVAVLAGWADRTLFDSREFADRAVVVLRDGRVRQELGEAIADQLEAAGVSDVVAFRSELLPIIVDVVGTPGFEAIFRRAVETAHRAAVSQHAGTAVLELGETIEIFASSAAATGNPGLAQTLERRAGSLLIDAGPVLARLDLYRLSERVRWLDDVALVLTVFAFAAALLLDGDRRRAVRRIGIGAVVAGLVVVVVTLLAPSIAAREVDDHALAAAVSGAVGRFTADLLTIGLWVLVVGVLLAAAAEAAGVPRPHVTERAGAAWRWVESAPRRQAVGGIVLLLVAALLIVAGDAVVSLVLVLAGIALAYVGAVLCITAAFGAPPADRPAAHRLSTRAVGVAAAAVLVALVAVGAVLTVGAARSAARVSTQLECNGSAEVCDRRLDQVALAGAHNAMSAATTPGWLFPEQLTGIPAQLEYGVRALLVKTHYGTPTGVEIGGAEIVVTNVAAESTVDRSDEVAELSAEAVARAQQLEQTVPVQAADRSIYLCHVYCSLGAIQFSDVLTQLKRFMDRNPYEVIMLFIGDYVSPEDTAAAFAQAGLVDRVWTYDTAAPPPTLRQMIDARQTLLVLSEHAGGTPAWYTQGYGIFQETPFTFTSPADFSCRPNRGPANAPLFELNHFITTNAPPSIDTTRQVNAFDVLDARARHCAEARHLMPNIVAVNFVTEGDVLEVVENLNEDPPVTSRATPSTGPTTAAPPVSTG